MSSLLIDVGNSRLKWALAADGALHASTALDHAGGMAAAVAAIEAAPRSIWISNVTSAAAGAELAAALQVRFGVAARFAAVAAERDGLRVAYAQPRRLGVDRWLGMLAQWTSTRCAFCIAGAGTALTFDAVDDTGRHLGGVIAPGLPAMQQAVLATTHIAAASAGQAFESGLGTDTESCIRQGALHAACGLFERLAQRYGGGACLLAGGDAPRLLPQLSGRWELRGNIVLEGLATLARDHEGRLG